MRGRRPSDAIILLMIASELLASPFLFPVIHVLVLTITYTMQRVYLILI